MTDDLHTRADKFLWFVRIFKTRSLASEACRKGRIIINNIPVKASHIVKTGDRVEVRKPPVNYVYTVKSFPKSRISAKLVPDFIQDITSPDELLKLEMKETFFIKRDRGTGRPTKKDRRTLDNLRS
jgi:ribosome-associated heat shock protein Hsp15